MSATEPIRLTNEQRRAVLLRDAIILKVRKTKNIQEIEAVLETLKKINKELGI